jgi:hypothetical protein
MILALDKRTSTSWLMVYVTSSRLNCHAPLCIHTARDLVMSSFVHRESDTEACFDLTGYCTGACPESTIAVGKNSSTLAALMESLSQ